MLDAVHRMSGPGKAIATGSTALAYQTQSKPFFLWLAETGKDARGQEPGKEDTILDPQIVEDFRIAMDLRATLGDREKPQLVLLGDALDLGLSLRSSFP